MAGFSYQHHHQQQQQPFLLDSESILLPNMEQRNSNIMNCDTNFFSQFCPLDAGALETSCVVHNSDNEPSNNNSAVTKNQSTVSSPEQQVTQSTVTNLHMSKKRKTRNNASSLNSAQSMDPRGVQVKGKKQNKSCNGDDDAMNNRNTEESKNPNDKAEKKKKKKKEELVSEEAPKDYIHVRARRGQATDSHSLAERARREKISERMKVLQRLVPGCDKVTGKAIMLDEIINYVQSLQNQVEFLSMKLASVNPLFYDYGMDLDNALMARPADHNQKLQRIAAAAAGAPATSSPLQCSPTSYQLTAFAHDNHDHHHHHQNINYPNLDAASAATLLLLQGQRPNALISQDNGSSLLWDVEEEQKLKLLDPSVVFSNNLCSFH